MTVVHTRLPSPELLLHWRLTRLHVSFILIDFHTILYLITDLSLLLGLQTPRLKRLAEIVSAQAIAQQEKFEYGSQDGYENGALEEVDEIPEPIEASA